MKQRGISVLNPEELKKLKEKIAKTEIDEEVKSIIQILPVILNYPERDDDLPSKHFRGEIFTGRAYQSLHWLTKALKFYFNSIGANIDDMKILQEALPFVLFHRSFNLATQESLSEFKEGKYREGMEYLYYWDLAKKVSEEAINEAQNVLEALREYSEDIPTAIAIMRVEYQNKGVADDRLKPLLHYFQ